MENVDGSDLEQFSFGGSANPQDSLLLPGGSGGRAVDVIVVVYLWRSKGGGECHRSDEWSGATKHGKEIHTHVAGSWREGGEGKRKKRGNGSRRKTNQKNANRVERKGKTKITTTGKYGRKW